jgi:hypothetical protein
MSGITGRSMYHLEGMFMQRILCECCSSTVQCQNCAALHVEVISAELWADMTELNTAVSFSEYGGNLLLSIEQETEELCLEVNGIDGKRWKQSMNLWQHLLMQYNVWKHTDIM